MSYTETLKTSDDGQVRVRLIQDEDASEPYDDGQSPLLRIGQGYNGAQAEHVMATGRPLDDDARIKEAAERWGGPSDEDWPKFGKYLHAYYGTTTIKTWWSENYWYVTYDTARWREYIGVPAAKTESWLADHADSINMDEYRAWCEGDCWGYVVERRVTWHRDDAPDEAMHTWEDVDSCWGYYGQDYAEQCALEAYEHALTKPAPGITPEQLAAAIADIKRVSGLPPVH